MRSHELLAAVFVAAMGCASTSRATFVVEDVPVAPAETVVYKPGYVWVDGHWVHQRSGWAWTAGHHERDRPDHIWVQGHWARQGRAHVWVAGGWRARGHIVVR